MNSSEKGGERKTNEELLKDIIKQTDKIGKIRRGEVTPEKPQITPEKPQITPDIIDYRKKLQSILNEFQDLLNEQAEKPKNNLNNSEFKKD